MKKVIIIIIVLFSILGCESNINQGNSFETKSIKITSGDITVSRKCNEFDLNRKLKEIRGAKLITFMEKDLKANLDSIHNSTKFILNIFLDSVNNIETFQLLSQLQNPLGIRLNLDVSLHKRDGFYLLNKLEFLEIHGATRYHVNQLKDLSNLKILHLEWAKIDPFPSIFNSNLSLHYLNLTLSKIKNIPASFSNQPCLEELVITKSELSNLPLGDNLESLKRINIYRVGGLKLHDNLGSLNSLEIITFDRYLLEEQENFNLSNFEKSSDSNHETIIFTRK